MHDTVDGACGVLLQSYEVNLLLTSVLSRLAAFPHPVIDSLFSPNITTSNSVYAVLRKVCIYTVHDAEAARLTRKAGRRERRERRRGREVWRDGGREVEGGRDEGRELEEGRDGEREGWREGGSCKKGGMERGRDGGKEGVERREGWREGGMEGRRELKEGRDGEREGARKGRKKGGDNREWWENQLRM